MAARLFLSNEGGGYGYKYDDYGWMLSAPDASFTADLVLNFIAPEPGTVVDAVLGCNMGADASNPLFLELEVAINGTSVWTTKPKVDKAAGAAWKNTIATATGVTVGVLDSTKVTVAKGDKITVTFDITRTASPGTEITDPCAFVKFRRDVGSTP